MKVLSIRQPWASLIINGYKEYEFRSWHTNFRGEILIHSSKGIDKDAANKFKYLGLEYPTGVIIGSVNITDCIKVDKEFKDELLSKNKQVYGEVKVDFSYALKLEEIRKLDETIPATGQLGIWNYYSEFDTMKLMDDIDYGWLDSGIPLLSDDKDGSKSYILQGPKDIIKSKVGICWEQVELERYYLKNNNWDIKTYLICYYTKSTCPTHTFLTYKKGTSIYWFEHSWEKYRGIHKYDNLKDLLCDVKSKFIEAELNVNCDEDYLKIYEYEKPKYGITIAEFFKHCENGKTLDINNL